MSANTDNIQNASKLISEMIRLIRIYEVGAVVASPELTLTLTGQQVTELKQVFAAKRIDCIAAINAVTA